MATNKSNELNNNAMQFGKIARKKSTVSVSSVSSGMSDSSEEGVGKLQRKSSLQDFGDTVACLKKEIEFCRRRSLSAGNVTKPGDPIFEAFPSLPNSVLEKMGLHGDGPRERLSDEELEQKFAGLALAFSTDSATINDRCERQRRNCDQTENNLSLEIGKLKEKLSLIQPLCTDFESAELLAILFTQVDVIMKASSLVSISAERYGAVQHEERLTESVHLMVNYVQSLKQQRDFARRQLQYTKRVLQNPGESPASSPTSNPQKTLLIPNRKVIGRRRASIATISQPSQETNGTLFDVKKLARRTSELSLRASSLNRNIRPSRLEMGMELVKIKEGYVDDEVLWQNIKEGAEHENHNLPENSKETSLPDNETVNQAPQKPDFSLSGRLKHRCRRINSKLQEKYKRWSETGTLHECFCFCALLCFSISILTMVGIIIEYEYAKRGIKGSHIFWSLSSESSSCNYNCKKYSNH